MQTDLARGGRRLRIAADLLDRFPELALVNVRGLPWVLRERQPMEAGLDDQLQLLDRRRFAERRSLFTRHDWEPPPTAVPAAFGDHAEQYEQQGMVG